jgi:hypothetical protein
LVERRQGGSDTTVNFLLSRKRCRGQEPRGAEVFSTCFV